MRTKVAPLGLLALMKSLRHVKLGLAAPTSHISWRSFASVSAAHPLASSTARSATRKHFQHARPPLMTLFSKQIYIF
jgi:hypothetical protein